jgi:hypothetical protein
MATIPMHAVAATYLCRSALFRSGISVEYTYAELPAAKPPKLDAEELQTIEREILDQLCIDEKSRARLQPKVHRTVTSNAKMYEGVTHCEAAIMAALSCDDITPQSLKESFFTLRQEVGVLPGLLFQCILNQIIKPVRDLSTSECESLTNIRVLQLIN